VPSSAPSSSPSSAARSVSQSNSRGNKRQQTSLALASASGRSKTRGLYFLQDFVEVRGGTARCGESGDGGEEFHVDLKGRRTLLVGLRSLGVVEALVGKSAYIWLGLERLAHSEEDLQLARGEVESAGGAVCHGGGRVVDVFCGVGVLLG
jgi:hypothetical protein